jgi:cytochrome bd-type quinol oxidase subunit 2
MSPVFTHVVYLAMSAAVLALGIAGLAMVLGLDRVRERAATAAVVLAMGSWVIPIVESAVASIRVPFFGAEPVLGDWPLAFAFVVGHVVLAASLLARRLSPDAERARYDARERDRQRARRSVPVRNDEVSP